MSNIPNIIAKSIEDNSDFKENKWVITIKDE
jgi:hypothetical protein